MSARTPLVVAFLGALIAGRAEAQSGGACSLGWNTLDGGGPVVAGLAAGAAAGEVRGQDYCFAPPPAATFHPLRRGRPVRFVLGLRFGR